MGVPEFGARVWKDRGPLPRSGHCWRGACAWPGPDVRGPACACCRAMPRLPCS